jgi:CheY-like chemotaxis protein
MSTAADTVNILLVDDRRDNLLALEGILRSLNQNLIHARSGAEALKYLLRNEAAVILLDVEMPQLDGFQTAALIRERDKSRHTPIIFLSAISKTDVQVSHGYSMGGVDYIFKPFAPMFSSRKCRLLWTCTNSREVQRQSALLKTGGILRPPILEPSTALSSSWIMTRASCVNRAWEAMTGYTNNEVQGNLLCDFLEDREARRRSAPSPNGETGNEQYWLTRTNARRLVS